MKTIQQIEEKMECEHSKALKLFATTELERKCIISSLVNAYLAGHGDASTEASIYSCKTAPVSR